MALRIDIPGHKVTMGLPKARKCHGNGGLIVAGVEINNRYYTTGVTAGECKVVQHNRERKVNLATGRPKSTNTNRKQIYHKIRDKKILTFSYEQISKKKGSNTKGTDDVTLDSYSKDTIQSVSNSLKDHSFKFKPIRRLEIPKPNGGTRPLGIPGPRDKVIQKAMTIALEEIYENRFMDSSHGFRPKRGVHTALKQVTGWTGIR